MCWMCDKVFDEIKYNQKHKVMYVGDGDGFAMVPGFGDRHRDFCRLLNVDTPEKGFPGFDESKKFLSDLVYGKDVQIEYQRRDKPTRDKYGRLLVYAFIEGKLVNAEIIREGLSMWVTRWGRGQFRCIIQHAETQACDERKGIWKYYDSKQRTYWGRGSGKIWFRSAEEMEKYRIEAVKRGGVKDGEISSDIGFFAWLNRGKLFLEEQRRLIRPIERLSRKSEYCASTENSGITTGDVGQLGGSS